MSQQTVNIEWHDARFFFGTYTKEDCIKHKMCLFNGIGYLLEKNDTTTIIAAERNDEGEYRNVTLIPTGSITSIKELLEREHKMDGLITKTIEQFFVENPPKEFEPCAYYDKHLDCIRVQIENCSFTEIRLNKIFTIYQANHVDCMKYIGFSIKGVRYIFEKSGFLESKQGAIILADVISAIIKANPDAFSDLIQREFSNMLDLEVKDFRNVPVYGSAF